MCAPPESSWGPPPALAMIHTTKFLVESGSAVVLRPDDIVQIGQYTLKFQRDFSQPIGELDDVQVKSSGNTGVVIDTDDEEQQVFETGTNDILSNSNQALSTPDVQSDGAIVKMETIMETPAASRHQDPAAVKAGPVLSCIDEKVLRDKDDNQENEEFLSNTRVVAESNDDRTISVDGSAIQTLRVQDNDSLSNSVLPDSIGIISDFDTETREIPPIRLDQMEEDLQMSTAIPISQPLQTPLQSQEHASNLPPSIPTSAPYINGQKTVEASDGISVQFPPEVRHSDSYQVPELSTKTRKRKRLKEESEVHTTKVAFQIQIPTNEPVRAYKTPNKRQKPDPATISSSSMLDSTRRSTPESPRGPDKPSPLVRSTRSSLLDPASPHPFTGTGMKIMFARSSSVYQNPKLMKFLMSKGVSKVKSVKDCDILCVSSGQLKKTSNLVLAVLYGKQIINDEWAQDSNARGQLQDIHDYLARDPEREAEWGINLSEAIQRGKNNVKPLEGYIVYFTEAAKKELGSGYSELKEIALLAGSKAIRLGFSQKITMDGGHQDPMIVIASQNEDLDHLIGLQKKKKKEKEEEEEGEGFSGCFSKDIITLSALRGVLDTQSEEFLIAKVS